MHTGEQSTGRLYMLCWCERTVYTLINYSLLLQDLLATSSTLHRCRCSLRFPANDFHVNIYCGSSPELITLGEGEAVYFDYHHYSAWTSPQCDFSCMHVLSDDLRTLILSHWLDVRSLGLLDVAISSKSSRPYWMTFLGSLRSTSIDEMDHNALSLMWLIQRGMRVSRVQIKANS
jgi:hypothetical protein